MPFIAIALVLAAAIGGGASFAAQNALPGDMLWGFRVGVIEQLGAVLAPSDKAQADFDLALVETRLKEAQKLKAEGRLSAEAEAQLSANLTKYAQRIERKIAQLRSAGDVNAAADVAARYQATLAVHGGTLAEAHAILTSASALSAQLAAESAAQASAGAQVDAGIKVDVGSSAQVAI